MIDNIEVALTIIGFLGIRALPLSDFKESSTFIKLDILHLILF